jgi:hypothetical protein
MTDATPQSEPISWHKTVLAWEVVGILLITIVGTSLHFWFEWLGYWRPAALFAAVNESTWEHFKMAFWPTLTYGLIEYPFLKDKTRNFWLAKFAGLLTMPIVTAILFYSYTAITGHHYLIADAVIFVLSVIAGQLVSYKLLTSGQAAKQSIQRLAIAGIVVMVLAFSLLSYFAPRNFLFEHPEGGEYGILESYEDHDHDGEDDH